MKDKILCIIQARASSTRLPKKVLKTINGVTILSHVIRRVALSKILDKDNILIATTDGEEDDEIIRVAVEEGVKTFRGSKNDVLDRYYRAAKINSADTILRITSDCPLIDYDVIDRVIEVFKNNKNIDYCSNRLKPSFPEGLDTEIVSFDALEVAWEESKDPHDREHVTPYIYRSGKFKAKNVPFKSNLSYLHFSVDYEKDYEFVKLVYSSLADKGHKFVLNDILNLLAEKPEILKVNQEPAYYKFLEYISQKSIKRGA